ncbi:FKBP-type peptidyl-prolyl cis-trans isomerase [Gordonia shandongensis]|uniref:FKBP-type peptidyl-prolyl cis-trans isomerase n=1 Tax=Gordonia shandongensis TaxID=376351 RepID=UPI00041DE749|nr:FKBP-type peptidyl-prolyl cis-trans isomerase [Gordonia shandongensis]
MKLKALAVVPAAVLALALTAGCSSDSDDASASASTAGDGTSSQPCEPVAADASPTWKLDGTAGSVTVAVTDDAANKAPSVDLTTPFSVDETAVHTLVKGDGDVVCEDSTADVLYEGVNGRDSRVFDSSYANGTPVPFPVSTVVAGFQKALIGQTVGSTVAVAMPPADGYGPSGGSPDAGIEPDDSLVFVLKITGTTGS